MSFGLKLHFSVGVGMTTRRVSLGLVAQKLRLSRTALEKWGRKGVLKIEWTDNKRCCHEDSINTLLQQRSRGFEKPPTWVDLATGALTFLTTKEVSRRLGISESSVRLHGQNGKLAAIKLGERVVRYSEVSVAQRQAAQRMLTQSEAATQQTFTLQQTAHILGVGKKAIYVLIEDGKLATNGMRGKGLGITTDSLIALLPSFLPDWMSPHVWIKARLFSTCGFLSVRELLPSETKRDHVTALLNERKLQYIQPIAKGKRHRSTLIPADSALAYAKEYEQSHYPEELGTFFDVPSEYIGYWDLRFPDWRTCYLHPHFDALLYTTCVVKIIGRYLQWGSPLKWYNSRLEGKGKVVGDAEAMRLLGIRKRQAFSSVIQQHHITHLTTPDDGNRYSLKTITNLRIALRQAARSA